MSTRNPAEAKRLSYEIKGGKALHDRWNEQRYDLMSELVKAKFEQNPDLKTELLAYGNKRIAESGKHDYYAAGLSITHRDILNPAKWTSNGNQTRRDFDECA